MYLLIIFFRKTFSLLVQLQPRNHKTLSRRREPQDLFVTHYDCEDNQQKTLHTYSSNQVLQCESEPQDIKSTIVKATLYTKPELQF